MGNQLDIFSMSGSELRDMGIQQAIDSAEVITPNWSQLAFEFLCRYIRTHEVFMMEEVRIASEGTVPEPPSKRAWGGVVVRAVKAGMIQRKGFRNVTNAKAHCTPATLWETI